MVLWSKDSSHRAGLTPICHILSLVPSTDLISFMDLKARLCTGLLNQTWPLLSHEILSSLVSRTVRFSFLKIGSASMDMKNLKRSLTSRGIFTVRFHQILWFSTWLVWMMLCLDLSCLGLFHGFSVYLVYRVLSYILFSCILCWSNETGEWADSEWQSCDEVEIASTRQNFGSCSNTWVSYSSCFWSMPIQFHWSHEFWFVAVVMWWSSIYGTRLPLTSVRSLRHMKTLRVLLWWPLSTRNDLEVSNSKSLLIVYIC